MSPLNELLECRKKDIDRINNQRRMWLYASSVVFSGIIFLIFGWDWLSGIQSKSIWWVIVGIMLIISINWWYWTMRVLRIIIDYQSGEYALITTIISDIHILKKDIKDFHDQTLDLLK